MCLCVCAALLCFVSQVLQLKYTWLRPSKGSVKNQLHMVDVHIHQSFLQGGGRLKVYLVKKKCFSYEALLVNTMFVALWTQEWCRSY